MIILIIILMMATSKLSDGNELSCGICLKLFHDPRHLPCLHTFCLVCLQNLLGSSNSLKCPVCRAEHQLNNEGVEQLSVDRDALQKLPASLLQEKNGSGTCASCEEEAKLVAWCEECKMICQSCFDQHKRMASLRRHHIVENKETVPYEQKSIVIYCLKHAGQELNYLCTQCSELVCSKCLLVGNHKAHQYSMVEEARHSLETQMEELVSVEAAKREEFIEYLEKASKTEKAVEGSELLISEVNKIFDYFEASLKIQRNQLIQGVSQGVKKIWSQKELMEISLAQLDSFTRFAERTRKCTTDADYAAMVTQCIKLMEQLKNTHGDDVALDYRLKVIGYSAGMHVPLDEVFTVSDQPSLKLEPPSGLEIQISDWQFFRTIPVLVPVSVKVSLAVGGLPMCGQNLHKKYRLDVEVSIAWQQSGSL